MMTKPGYLNKFNDDGRNKLESFMFFILRLNGKALLDEDLLRSEGVSDFTKYRCSPAHQPPRMMPMRIPSLLVDEELEQTFPKL